MKQIKIQQKFFSFHEQFAIYDENDQAVFQARNQIVRLWNNITLFDQMGNLPLYTLRMKLSFIFAKYKVLAGDYESPNQVGMIKEGFGFFFTRAKVEVDNLPKIALVSGPIHLKGYLLDENGKKIKDQIVIKSTKKLLKIRDTYIIDYDETKVPSTLAALVGVWYDMVNHSGEH